MFMPNVTERFDNHNVQTMFIANSSGSGVAGTLDSSYYKGCGERLGIEREYVVVVKSNERICASAVWSI